MEDMALEGEHFHGRLGSSSGIKRTGCDFFLLPFSALSDLENLNNKMKWNKDVYCTPKNFINGYSKFMALHICDGFIFPF